MGRTSSKPSAPGDLARELLEGNAVVAGVLSGTSADGIDVALFRPHMGEAGPIGLGLIAFKTVDFDGRLGAELRHVLDGGPMDLGRLAYLNRDLGRAFGAAARDLAFDQGVRLDLVGSHGQTVWHHDGMGTRGAASLQLGDGDFVADAAGAAVVSDFRQGDLAAGGEGAPIGHLIDPWLYPKLARPCAILNLGGFGNLTMLGAGPETLSFDTGPAGSLLDGLARGCFGKDMDRGGKLAAQGEVRPDLFAAWLADLEPFLRTAPPRSTGRDTFGADWVAGLVEDRQGASGEDLLATGVAVVAACIQRSLQIAPGFGTPSELLVAGGGARNPELLKAIEGATSVPVTSSKVHGIDPDAREALIFGLLGVAHVLGISLPSCETGTGEEQPTPTGAKPGRVLGKYSPGPPLTGAL